MADEVLYEVDGRVATFTLNRPDQRNAVNPAVTELMNGFVEQFETDDDVWVGILTGAGDKAFSAGADLKAIASGQAGGIGAGKGGFGGFVRYARTKPVIAAVNGIAFAGGCELVLSCDIVVAAEHAEFGLFEVARGIIAAAGGLFRLPRAIPPKRALELIMTAGRMSAADAHALGLVNHVVPAGQLMDKAREVAALICKNAPVAVRESRAVALAAIMKDEEDLWKLSNEASSRVFSTEDAREGPMAFAQKREPEWKGR